MNAPHLAELEAIRLDETAPRNLVAIAQQLTEARRELREAADRDRQNVLRRELELERVRLNALAAACRAKDPNAEQALLDYGRALQHLLPLPCGCVLRRLDYSKRWAVECGSHQ